MLLDPFINWNIDMFFFDYSVIINNSSEMSNSMVINFRESLDSLDFLNSLNNLDDFFFRFNMFGLVPVSSRIH